MLYSLFEKGAKIHRMDSVLLRSCEKLIAPRRNAVAFFFLHPLDVPLVRKDASHSRKSKNGHKKTKCRFLTLMVLVHVFFVSDF